MDLARAERLSQEAVGGWVTRMRLNKDEPIDLNLFCLLWY